MRIKFYHQFFVYIMIINKVLKVNIRIYYKFINNMVSLFKKLKLYCN